MVIRTSQKLPLLALLACAALSGCIGSGNNFDETKISEVKTGVTTEADAIRLFVKLGMRANDADSRVLTWHHMKSSANVGLIFGFGNVTQKSLTLTFNKNGKVSKVESADATV